MATKEKRKKYVLNYYNSQFHQHGINLHHEIRVIGKFLLENVRGKTLDFGCGPALHFWGFFMNNTTILDGIDITPENIEFLNSYTRSINLKEYEGIQKYIQELLQNSSFRLSDQLKKIRKILIRDFTSNLDGIDNDYDTIVAPFSIGCVKNPLEYEKAIQNMSQHLNKGGKAIFFGTTGTSSCNIIPEYCYQGVKNNSKIIKKIFNKYFIDVNIQEVELEKEKSDMFPYSALILVTGIKK